MNRMKMLKIGLKALAAALLVAASSGLALAQSGTPSIMAPEPGMRPPRPQAAPEPAIRPEPRSDKPARRARGSSSGSPVPLYRSPPAPDFSMKRSIDGPGLTSAPAGPTPVPGFTNVPAPPTSLSGQTFQDKAIGCAHYGASQGVGAGQIGAYTGGCINSR